jgi:hypothetical protein
LGVDILPDQILKHDKSLHKEVLRRTKEGGGIAGKQVCSKPFFQHTGNTFVVQCAESRQFRLQRRLDWAACGGSYWGVDMEGLWFEASSGKKS